uniref:Uncharacterized protein n=1 Tax=Anguilla anguilla TaxID=7936 RepID=A0A0E9U4C7_ANGAN
MENSRSKKCGRFFL